MLVFLPGAGLSGPGASEWKRQMMRDGKGERQELLHLRELEVRDSCGSCRLEMGVQVT